MRLEVAKTRGRAGGKPSAEKLYRPINKMTVLTPAEYGGQMGGKRRGVPVKTLKKILKKAGLKTTGKKAALTRRAKQAKLVKKGGNVDPVAAEEMKVDGDAAETKAKEAEAEAKRAKEEADKMTAGRRRKSRSKKYFF
jgi:hypothetical protein